MLHLTLSNRFEYLQEALLQRLAAEFVDPFVAQQVIIPSTALRRQIELSCADRLGICANIDFSYLAQWLWTQIGRVVEIQSVSPFTPALLSWRVFEIFADRSFTAAHPRLERYLANADAVMCFDLAQRTATLMEHYLTYRPQWLAAWSEGQRARIVSKLQGLDAGSAEDELWQAALWRRITQELGTQRLHPAAAFFQKMESFGPEISAQISRVGLPAQASVFCLPTLPPLYLDILRQLARWMDIHIYALNPCQEYWFEIVDKKRLGYLAARQRETYLDVGNPLLASWGKQTQAHIDLLFSDDGQIVEQGSEFLPSAGGTLLHFLQNSILDLSELEPASFQLGEEDRSVEVHICHSLTREIEVLQDQLLALFAQEVTDTQPPYRPEQILVLLPDLEEAAPLIDAVFGTAPAGRRIPYTLTGQAQTRINPVARVLDSLLALCGGRFTASAVFDLLQQGPVAARFGLDADALQLIHDWIHLAGIRWGLDAEARDRLNLPASARHTFSDGIHRLFLSYALGDGAEAAQTVLSGRIGAGNPEGADALTLGAFWHFFEALQTLQKACSHPKEAAAWQHLLSEALQNFTLVKGDDIEDARSVNGALAELCGNMQKGGARSALPLDVVRSALVALLDDPARGGVPKGVLTFSAFSSLRTLPYRCICVLGLNDGAFPSTNRPVEFDLMALQPERGDRQRRLDERNLFLDLLLAVRERFYLSYSGRSIRDNSLVPPSVLLAELLDHIASIAADDPLDLDSMQAIRQRLCVEHPLQAFSRDYFLPDANPRRRSFNAEYCQALRQGLQETVAQSQPLDSPFIEEASDEDSDNLRESSEPFFSLKQPLPALAEEWRHVSLDQLQQFFVNPCRFLLSQRLNIALPAIEEELADDEAFLPDYPSQQALSRRVLPSLLANAPLSEEALLALALAGNEYPLGRQGERWLGTELLALREFVAKLHIPLGDDVLPPVHAVFNFDFAGEAGLERWTLSGALGDVRSAGLLRYRFDELRPTDYLSGWLAHLFLCASGPVDSAQQTIWHGRQGQYRLHPVPPIDAKTQLCVLLALYRRGLSEPLPFFPKSAWSLLTEKNGPAAAKLRWHNERNPAWGEEADPAYQLALRGKANPLDADFEACARAVFSPLLPYLEEIK